MPKWLDRLCLGDAAAYLMWVSVGHPRSEEAVGVFLEGFGPPVDVTANNVMVDLWPLLVVIALPGGDLLPRLRDARLSLVLREPPPHGRELGRVGLRAADVFDLPPHHLYLFHTTGCTNYCLPPVRRRLTYLHERVRLAFDRNPHNQAMIPSEQFSNWLLYYSPRRLALVSYGDGRRGNVFPMDLIGTTDTPYYLLSLGLERPALAEIKAAGRLAVSTLPLGYSTAAYALGRNHRTAAIDWKDVPFPTAPSPEYGIPAPRDAVTVREVAVARVFDTPTHAVLVTTTTRLTRRAGAPELCTVHRTFHADLARRGRALPTDGGAGPPAVVLNPGEFYHKRQFGPEVVNRGAVLLECEWAGGEFESGMMLGGIFRAGRVRGGTFSGALFWAGTWEAGTWRGGFDRRGRYRPRTDHPPHA